MTEHTDLPASQLFGLGLHCSTMAAKAEPTHSNRALAYDVRGSEQIYTSLQDYLQL